MDNIKIREFNLRSLNSKEFRNIMKKIYEIEKTMGFVNKKYPIDSLVWVEMILDNIENNVKESQMGGFRVKINPKSISFFPDFSLRLNLDEEDIKDIKRFKK